MNPIKTYITRAMVAIAAMAIVVGCNGGDDTDKVPTDGDLNLSITVEDITTTTAKIKVAHAGDTSSTWLGFVTDDVTTNEDELIANHISAGIDSSELHASRQYATIVEELQPETTYKYIAVGYTTEGGAYGKSAAVEFTTLKASDGAPIDNTAGMTLNDAWTVKYVGGKTIDNLSYDHVVEVDSRDNNSYVIAVVTAEQWATESLKAMSEALLSDMFDYLDYFNQTNGTSYTIADMLCLGDGIDGFDLTPGEYRALAIGINRSGELSYLYAVSEEFEVKEAVASEAYKSWLGDWVIVGQNNVSCPVTISQNVANKSVWMTGWEGYDDLAVSVEYDSSLNALLFHSQLVATGYDLGEDYGTADIYFFGGDDDGYYYDNQEGDYYIGIGGILDDGARAIVRYGVGVTGYPRFSQMFFMAYINGGVYALSAEEDIPSYVAIMDPAGSQYATPKPLIKRLHAPRKTTLRKL